MVGTVKELGLFATTVITPDNVVTVVGNGKVFGDNIQNYSALPVRRVDCVAKVANSVNPLDAIARLQPVIAAIPNVASDPAPVIEILEFTPEGPKLCVRPFTPHRPLLHVIPLRHPLKDIVETFGAAGYPVPETPWPTASRPRNNALKRLRLCAQAHKKSHSASAYNPWQKAALARQSTATHRLVHFF